MKPRPKKSPSVVTFPSAGCPILACLPVFSHLLLTLILPAATSSSIEAAAETSRKSDYFRIELYGELAGRIQQETAIRNGVILEITSFLDLKLRRLGEDLAICERERFRPSRPATLDCWTVPSLGDTLHRIFQFEDGVLLKTSPTGSTRSLGPLPGNLVLPDGHKEWFREQWDRGKCHAFVEFSTDLERFISSQVTVGEVESFAFGNDEVAVRPFRFAPDGAPELARTEWRSRDGQLYRAQTDIVGLALYRVTSPVVPAQKGVSLDSIMLLPVQFFFEDQRSYPKLRYRVTWPVGAPSFAPCETPRITSIRTGKTSAVFEVAQVPVSTHRTTPLPSQAGEELGGQASLEPSTWIESQDPAITSIAEQVVAGAKNPWGRVLRITDFVHQHIQNKSGRIYFATARATLDSGEGDCTEHAVLLAALSRAVDIPARIVSGWIGIGRQMGYHLWTEVYVSGNWIGVDGVFARAPVDARYLPLAASNLSGPPSSELSLAILRSARGLQIEILEQETETAP